MNQIMLSIIAVVCVVGSTSLSYAEDMGNTSNEMKSEMKGQKDEMKIKPGAGDTARGKEVFHGKGICFFCHGHEGCLNHRPPLHPETEQIIGNLNSPPADLRNAGSLRLKTDKERFHIVRSGHLGTGMLPDTTLTDDEITDLLAYLATLRSQGASIPSTSSGGTKCAENRM